MRSAGFVALILVFVLIAVALTNPSTNVKDVAIGDVIKRANNGELQSIEQEGSTLFITPKGEEEPTEKAVVPADVDLLEKLDLSKVSFGAAQESNTGSIVSNLVFAFLPEFD